MKVSLKFIDYDIGIRHKDKNYIVWLKIARQDDLTPSSDPDMAQVENYPKLEEKEVHIRGSIRCLDDGKCEMPFATLFEANRYFQFVNDKILKWDSHTIEREFDLWMNAISAGAIDRLVREAREVADSILHLNDDIYRQNLISGITKTLKNDKYSLPLSVTIEPPVEAQNLIRRYFNRLAFRYLGKNEQTTRLGKMVPWYKATINGQEQYFPADPKRLIHFWVSPLSILPSVRVSVWIGQTTEVFG